MWTDLATLTVYPISLILQVFSKTWLVITLKHPAVVLLNFVPMFLIFFCECSS